MYRRRRSNREKIPFSFDSFLDVVANVIGIVIRLILVAWVGARAYTTSMTWNDETPALDAKAVATADAKADAKPPVDAKIDPLPETPDPTEEKPHPLEKNIAGAKKEIDEARRRLLAYLDQLEGARSKRDRARGEVEGLKKEHTRLVSHVKKEEAADEAIKARLDLAALSVDKLKERGEELLTQIQALEKEPIPKKLLRYRTPVSRIVEGEELLFECREGRVSFIDLAAFMHEIRGGINDAKIEEIAKLGTWTSTTSPVGAFRVRYTFESEREVSRVRVVLTEYIFEPVAARRGESEAEALRPGSDFRAIVDRLDPSQTTVTFWVYPDSFPVFRALRDHLYEGGVEVAGRPLPQHAPIGGSIHGTRSRGQ